MHCLSPYITFVSYEPFDVLGPHFSERAAQSKKKMSECQLNICAHNGGEGHTRNIGVCMCLWMWIRINVQMPQTQQYFKFNWISPHHSGASI